MYSSEKVVVARAKENKEWDEGPVPTMFTAIYAINIKTEEQKQILFPKNNEMDGHPQAIGSYLTWLRTDSNKTQGNVWINEGLTGQEYIWIRDVDSAPVFLSPSSAD